MVDLDKIDCLSYHQCMYVAYDTHHTVKLIKTEEQPSYLIYLPRQKMCVCMHVWEFLDKSFMMHALYWHVYTVWNHAYISNWKEPGKRGYSTISRIIIKLKPMHAKWQCQWFASGSTKCTLTMLRQAEREVSWHLKKSVQLEFGRSYMDSIPAGTWNFFRCQLTSFSACLNT